MLGGEQAALPRSVASLVVSTSPTIAGVALPTWKVAELSPCIPSMKAVTSMFTMSPHSSGRSSGMPWQMTPFTDV
jgi:hypothetical protein